MDITQSLEFLSSLNSVAGFEKQAAQRLVEFFKDYCDEAKVDKFFNVICTKKGVNSKNAAAAQAVKKIMITAHSDEIGFLVNSIDEKGFIGVTNVGGIDSKILLAQEVVIHGSKDIIGIIGATPPHLLKPEDVGKAAKISELRVDTGYKGEELKKIVSLGDTVTIKASVGKLNGSKVYGRAIDNKAGVACLLEILKLLQNVKHENDIVVVATTQEETYLTGVMTASYSLRPDAALVIDVTHGDMPDASKDNTSSLGKGPEISMGPNLHPKMVEKCFEIGKENGIPFQKMVEAGDTGTEAWATQVSANGIPTALLSIPVRYMHTSVETACIQDIKHTARMAAKFVEMSGLQLKEVLCL